MVSCDLVGGVNLRELVLTYHAHQSALTALLVQTPPPQDTPTPKKSSKATPTDLDLVGVSRDGEDIVIFSSVADLEEEMAFSSTLLTR